MDILNKILWLSHQMCVHDAHALALDKHTIQPKIRRKSKCNTIELHFKRMCVAISNFSLSALSPSLCLSPSLSLRLFLSLVAEPFNCTNIRYLGPSVHVLGPRNKNRFFICFETFGASQVLNRSLPIRMDVILVGHNNYSLAVQCASDAHKSLLHIRRHYQKRQKTRSGHTNYPEMRHESLKQALRQHSCSSLTHAHGQQHRKLLEWFAVKSDLKSTECI